MPGSTDWWVETALITAGGVFLALWLWPAPPETAPGLPAGRGEGEVMPEGSLADLLARGCLTADDLQALRDGRTLRPVCPPAGIRIR